ncbi:MAG: NUDIX domain-containing protein [Gammaproteobacteria bacterium]|nr:NUDIX domain-containing protein [Gammaproteobacteria bacterium]MDH5730828.1 NUDIX domain-containing protein [Gammaproteobacteria bacterium]
MEKFCMSCGAELKEQEIDGFPRRVCTQSECDFVLWRNPVPVVAAIVEYQAQIVLAHNKLWPAGIYGLITGYLEQYEHPDQAVLREVEEELGLTASIQSFIGHYASEQKNQLLLAYHVNCDHGEISLNHELDDYKLINKQDLKPWDLGTGLAVRDWLYTQVMNKD